MNKKNKKPSIAIFGLTSCEGCQFAILTFKEYLLDYASPQTRKIGEQVIAGEVKEIKNQAVKISLFNKLESLEKGERDLYF